MAKAKKKAPTRPSPGISGDYIKDFEGTKEKEA